MASVRRAQPGDVPALLQFLRELASFEHLQHLLDLDAERLARHLFGPFAAGEGPACHALLAVLDAGSEREVAVGFALFYPTYSTFRTQPCLYLEDLYVTPAQRGAGIGLRLLRAVATEAQRRGAARLDWSVLDWNHGAIGFYQRQGAQLLPDWRICRLEGSALAELAGPGPICPPAGPATA